MTVDNKNCRNCKYFHGRFDETCCCNYLLMTGKRRPCPPGAGCTVKVKRKRPRRMREDREAAIKIAKPYDGVR